MKVAAVQMTSTRDVQANLREAGRLVAEAARQGAKLVVLPENFSFLGATDADRVAAIERFGDGPAQQFLAETAEQQGLWIVGGTIPIRDAGSNAGGRAMRGAIADSDERASSRSLLVGPDGRVAAHYDKIHLFDVDIPGRTAERYMESASTLAGTRVVAATTPLARIGMTVCYDIRFPALFHRLSVLGTDIVVVPAAFTVPTGEVHWLPLLQARAIESLVYVVAAGQCGEHAGGRKTYGHSLILGPWGELLAELPAGPGIACADLDMIRLAELRQRFPAVQHRREL
jgi:predicted amidohydrolase